MGVAAARPGRAAAVLLGLLLALALPTRRLRGGPYRREPGAAGGHGRPARLHRGNCNNGNCNNGTNNDGRADGL